MKKDIKAKYEQWLEKGMEGLIPIYDKDGRNATLIILENQPSIQEQNRLCTVLEGLANLYQKNLDLIKKQARDITGQKTMNPLPLLPVGILVPFRMRKPIGRNDGAVGYFFHHAIEEIEKRDDRVYVILKDGQMFSVMDSFAGARHHIRCACQIHDRLLNFYDTGVLGVYGLCMEWGEFYNQPATRADIAMVLRDLKTLTDRIER